MVVVVVPLETCVGLAVGVVEEELLLLGVVLTETVPDEGVALTDTLTDAGLVGAKLLVGATVASDVRAPVRLYRAAQLVRSSPFGQHHVPSLLSVQ